MEILRFQPRKSHRKSVPEGLPFETVHTFIILGNMMTAAAYMRVSTADQLPDLQQDGITAFAERAGLDVVASYLAAAVSGRKEGRPQLDALMKAARRRAFDCVLVWKFDRFARSTSHLIRALEEFNHLGIRFISVQDQVDTDSPMGKAMFTIIGAMAELESDLISERVKAGMEAARSRGRHVGRPETPADVVLCIPGKVNS